MSEFNHEHEFDHEKQNQTESFPEKLANALRFFQEESEALEAQRATRAAEFADADQKRADAARKGELGPEWRTIQKRIDTGQTSVADVFSGTDTSPEAETLRRMSRRNLERLRASWGDVVEDDDDETPVQLAPHQQAQGLAREAQEKFDKISAQIAQALREAQGGSR